MTSIQDKIADAVLTRIREKREPADGASPAFPRGANAKVAVREVQLSDYERVHSLTTRLGQGPDSPENWTRLWIDNPSLQARMASRVGWMLESNGEIVGFLGSIPLLYEFQGMTFRAAATCRFAVDPAYRAFSHLLVTSFFRQKEADLFLNTSATVAAGKIMAALKAAPLPQPDYGEVLFWVLDSGQFAGVLLRKMGIASPVQVAAGPLLSLAIKGEGALRGRAPGGTAAALSVVEFGLHELGEDFDRFCARNLAHRSQLMAKRGSAIMRWHFCPPASRRKAVALLCMEQGQIVGYAIIRHDTDDNSGLRRSLIADLLVDDDDPHVAMALIAGAYRNAERQRSHVLEVMGFPNHIRKPLLKWKPYVRQYPACPFYYKAVDKALQDKLASEDYWYACPFDGDSTLWP